MRTTATTQGQQLRTGNYISASVMAISHHEKCTDKYKFISTMDVIEKAREFGWEITKTAEANSKKFRGYQKHIVIMENLARKNEEGNIQLVIRNAHNGTNSLQVFLGFMRINCANQLFARDLGEGTSIRIRHSQKGLAEFSTFLENFDSGINSFASGIKTLQEKILSPDQVRVFAKNALALRFEDKKITDDAIDQALAVRRDGDEGDSAWRVFNRLQETMIRGGITLVNPDAKKRKKVKARGIVGIDSVLGINSKLMEMAFELV